VPTLTENAIPGFSQVYEAYHEKVRAWAARLTGPDEADDVAQEVFVKVGRSLGTLADPSKLTSWIYTILLNTVRDMARKRASRGEGTGATPRAAWQDGAGTAPPAGQAGDGPRTPEEIAIRNEMVACYLEFVEQLPRTQYEVYVLSEFEHLSNEAIARRLSLSLGTVKIRLHRARRRVNDALRCHCRPYVNERGELMGEPKDG
jgi:RNA polymerase sigma-70 factor (ECF subfamily)